MARTAPAIVDFAASVISLSAVKARVRGKEGSGAESEVGAASEVWAETQVSSGPAGGGRTGSRGGGRGGEREASIREQGQGEGGGAGEDSPQVAKGGRGRHVLPFADMADMLVMVQPSKRVPVQMEVAARLQEDALRVGESGARDGDGEGGASSGADGVLAQDQARGFPPRGLVYWPAFVSWPSFAPWLLPPPAPPLHSSPAGWWPTEFVGPSGLVVLVSVVREAALSLSLSLPPPLSPSLPPPPLPPLSPLRLLVPNSCLASLPLPASPLPCPPLTVSAPRSPPLPTCSGSLGILWDSLGCVWLDLRDRLTVAQGAVSDSLGRTHDESPRQSDAPPILVARQR